MNNKHFPEWLILKAKLHFNQRLPRISEGEIWWCSIGENIGVEINGKSARFTRPILIMKKLSSRSFMGVPLTTQPKTGSWYFNFHFAKKAQNAALCQARVISVSRLHSKLGQISQNELSNIRKAFIDLYQK